MTLRRLTLANVRGAWWAARALRQVREGVSRDGLEYAPALSPPNLPPSAYDGVLALLRRRQNTCLERALVLQRWHDAHGSPRAVVIGVRGGSFDFAAHAWLEGEGDDAVAPFTELMRLSPR